MFKFISLHIFVSVILVTACGPVPLPIKKAKIEATQPATTANRNVGSGKRIENKMPSKNTGGVATNTSSNTIVRQYLTPSEHVQQGIASLKTGSVDKAKIDFESALKKQPDNATAKKLLRQINTSVSEYFGEKTYIKTYTAQPGDTFSTLAAKYLNDPLEFHILAKFNNYKNPAELEAGKIIQVPSERPVKAPDIVTPKPAEPINVEYNLAKKYYEQGRYQSAIAVLEPRIQANENDFQSRDLLVLTYTKYAFYLADKANLLEAQTVLEKAVVIQPDNRQLKTQLNVIEKQRNADRQYSAGVKFLKSGNKEKALESFNKAIKLQPDHKLAREQISKLEASVVDTLHKKAMTLYSNQELDEAITNWNKVLKLNPEHDLAKLYRQRAVELKDRLDKL